MITAKEVNNILEQTGMQPSSLAKRLHIAPVKFRDDVLLNGLSDPVDIECFELYRKNLQMKDQFSFKEIEAFQQHYDIQDHELWLYWDLGHNAWYRMKRGEQDPTPQIRKLFRATKLLADEGYDIKRYIAQA